MSDERCADVLMLICRCAKCYCNDDAAKPRRGDILVARGERRRSITPG